MVYLVKIKDSEGRAKYLKSDRTWTEYWQDAEEFTRGNAKKKSSEFNSALVVEKFAYERIKR